MDEPSAAGRESRPAVKQGRREFLALMAAATATVAISIDAMLPAFGELREYLGLPSDSSSVALVVTVFFAGLGIGQFVYGPLADRFGRKPVFLAGLVLYATARLRHHAGNVALVDPDRPLLLGARCGRSSDRLAGVAARPVPR